MDLDILNSNENINVSTDNILASLESLDELLNNYSNLSNHSDSHLLSHITELKSKAKELLVSKDNLLDEKYIKHYLSTVTPNNSNNDERINNFISKFLILDKDNNDIYLYVDDDIFWYEEQLSTLILFFLLGFIGSLPVVNHIYITSRCFYFDNWIFYNNPFIDVLQFIKNNEKVKEVVGIAQSNILSFTDIYILSEFTDRIEKRIDTCRLFTYFKLDNITRQVIKDLITIMLNKLVAKNILSKDVLEEVNKSDHEILILSPILESSEQ